jgi:hypothetical protein
MLLNPDMLKKMIFIFMALLQLSDHFSCLAGVYRVSAGMLAWIGVTAVAVPLK